MSNPELIYLAPECHEEGERLWCEDDVWESCHEHDGEHCEESHPSVRYVRGDVHDAQAQQCRELEAELKASRTVTQRQVANSGRLIRDNDTLRAEVTDLKARLLEAERGAEELVQLRTERRGLLEALEGIRKEMGFEWLLPEFDAARSALEAAHD